MLFTLGTAAKRIRWYHSIHLPDGSITNGIDKSDLRYNLLRSQWENQVYFRGRSVLDVGAWDGYFSFKAEELGAERVLATDHYCWSGNGWGNKEGFDFAKRYRNSEVEELDIDIQDLSPESVGRFDISLFLGVLYHRIDFFSALAAVASVTHHQILIETALDKEIDQTIPLVKFYPFREYNNDPTNWFVPNHKTMEAMLAVLGFGIQNFFEFTFGRPPLPRGAYIAVRESPHPVF